MIRMIMVMVMTLTPTNVIMMTVMITMLTMMTVMTHDVLIHTHVSNEIFKDLNCS